MVMTVLNGQPLDNRKSPRKMPFFVTRRGGRWVARTVVYFFVWSLVSFAAVALCYTGDWRFILGSVLVWSGVTFLVFGRLTNPFWHLYFKSALLQTVVDIIVRSLGTPDGGGSRFDRGRHHGSGGDYAPDFGWRP